MMEKKSSKKKKGSKVTWLLGGVLVILVGLMALSTESDYRSGAIYVQEAVGLGMDREAAEEYRLYCLSLRKENKRVPLAVDWAEERFERLHARPGSVLEMLIRDLWQPALDDEREAARQAEIVEERERERALYGYPAGLEE